MTRIALVTGGTGGIGTAICRRLASHQTRVAATYFPSLQSEAEKWQAMMKQEGLDIAIFPCDVSDFDSAKTMVEEVVKQFGKVDVLVNAAGVTSDKTLSKMESSQWVKVMRTNLDSVFNVTRQVIVGMAERKYGRIINISSVNGQKGQFGQTNYAASKAGVHAFTMSLAQEVAAKNVLVNTVSPGYVKTEMTGKINPEVLEAIVKEIPLGRMAKPEEISDVVAWLSAESNTYITGANIPINGGLYMSA